MIKIGDTIVFSGDGDDVVCIIKSISQDGIYILIADSEDALKINTNYKMTIALTRGLIAGVGTVVKIRENKFAKASLKKEDPVEYIVKITKPFKLIQSRNAYRHDCYFPIELIEFVDNNLDNPRQLRSHVTNISSGGLKILSDSQLAKDSIVNVVILISKSRLDLFGIIIDTSINENTNRPYKYISRLKFTYITEDDSAIIIKFIFEEYRKERRKLLQEKLRLDDEKSNNKH